MSDSNGGPLEKKPNLETRIESHQGSRKSSGSASGSSSDYRRRRARDIAFLMCCSTTSYALSSLVVQVGTLPNSRSMNSITPNTFVLDMLKGYHFQLFSIIP